ncbi:MAG TPA: PEP-CTERM sorting domain-containing protein [Gemmataceae bacterium]|nr:PEP-CTERM sorting domain-containing protein [Gemmataceae bacterium]
MNSRAVWKGIMMMALGAVLAFGSVAQADEIGINFTGGNNAGAPTSLLATDIAGVVPQANWNNANGTGATLNGLLNQNGVATTASVTWHADGTWGSGTGTASGNAKLYNGYLDSTGTSPTTVTVSGLAAAGLAGSYDVYVYFTGDGAGSNPPRSGNYTIGSITQLALDTIGFKGTFVQATPADANGGNYLVFSGLSGDSFTLSANPVNFRSPVNGIEIVSPAAAPVPEPTTLALAGMSLLSFMGYAWKRRRTAA